MTAGYLVLRKVRQSKWVDRPDWIPDGEAAADSLPDLQTTSNELSVYLIPEEVGADEMAARIAIALAATRESIDHFDYVLLAAPSVAGIPLELDLVDGETPDAHVNTLHRGLSKLTAVKVARLAGLIADAFRGVQVRRIFKPQVREAVKDGLREGRLTLEGLHPSLRDKFSSS